MLSDPADRTPRTGRPLLWAAGLVLSAALVAVVLALLREDETVLTPPPAPSPTPSVQGAVTGAEGASRLLDELAVVLREGSRYEALALAAPEVPAAQEAVGVLFDNVREIGMADLTLRFVDEEAGALDRSERRAMGPRAWRADVAVAWRVAGFDQGTSRMEVRFTFVDTADGVRFGSAGGGAEDAAPLWLLGEVDVARTPRALVLVAGDVRPGRYVGLARQAVSDVRAVLPRWRGRLVVEVPATQQQLDRALGAEPGTYAAIAAVTAKVDGTMTPGSPTHVLVNPGVFASLGAQGSQIVMSHEATHVATDAATSTMPMWLLEGFADYVALARSELPVALTASQILAEVRRDGPPRSLPGRAEFDPANKLLGTSYEAAWLAARLLAEEYGERRLVAFYDAVDAGRPAPAAFGEVLGTTQGAFTQRWRGYLRELAA